MWSTTRTRPSRWPSSVTSSGARSAPARRRDSRPARRSPPQSPPRPHRRRPRGESAASRSTWTFNRLRATNPTRRRRLARGPTRHGPARREARRSVTAGHSAGGLTARVAQRLRATAPSPESPCRLCAAVLQSLSAGDARRLEVGRSALVWVQTTSARHRRGCDGHRDTPVTETAGGRGRTCPCVVRVCRRGCDRQQIKSIAAAAVVIARYVAGTDGE